MARQRVLVLVLTTSTMYVLDTGSGRRNPLSSKMSPTLDHTGTRPHARHCTCHFKPNPWSASQPASPAILSNVVPFTSARESTARIYIYISSRLLGILVAPLRSSPRLPRPSQARAAVHPLEETTVDPWSRLLYSSWLRLFSTRSHLRPTPWPMVWTMSWLGSESSLASESYHSGRGGKFLSAG